MDVDGVSTDVLERFWVVSERSGAITHRIHVRYIYLYDLFGSRKIFYHTWTLWDLWVFGERYATGSGKPDPWENYYEHHALLRQLARNYTRRASLCPHQRAHLLRQQAWKDLKVIDLWLPEMVPTHETGESRKTRWQNGTISPKEEERLRHPKEIAMDQAGDCAQGGDWRHVEFLYPDI